MTMPCSQPAHLSQLQVLALSVPLLLLFCTKLVLSLDQTQAPPQAPPQDVDNYYYFPVCDYDGHKFPAGTVYSPAPCVECHCNATSGHVVCRVPPCPDLGPNCIKYEHHPGACCPTCVQRGCYHDDVFYLPGARIDVSPCKRCYCPQEVGEDHSGELTCLNVKCPDVRCVDAVTQHGECCPECPNGPNCWLDDKVIKEGERIYIDRCRFCYCSSMEYIYNATRRHATCVRSFFCL